MPMSHHALEVSPRTFSATCQNMQYRGQDWNVPVSQFIPKCPAQGQAEHQEMGQGMVDPLQNQADNTSFLTQQKAPHKHRPQKSKCLINQGAVFLFKKKKKMLPTVRTSRVGKHFSDNSVIGTDFSRGQRHWKNTQWIPSGKLWVIFLFVCF